MNFVGVQPIPEAGGLVQQRCEIGIFDGLENHESVDFTTVCIEKNDAVVKDGTFEVDSLNDLGMTGQDVKTTILEDLNVVVDMIIKGPQQIQVTIQPDEPVLRRSNSPLGASSRS